MQEPIGDAGTPTGHESLAGSSEGVGVLMRTYSQEGSEGEGVLMRAYSWRLGPP